MPWQTLIEGIIIIDKLKLGGIPAFMDNVYQKVALFYEKRSALNPLVRQSRIERYLRQLAWKGSSDDELRKIWGALSVLLDYVFSSGLFSFAALTEYDYHEIMYRLKDEHPEMKFNEHFVNGMFGIFSDFLSEYCGRDSAHVKAMETARESFFKDGVFSCPERPSFDSVYEKLNHEEEITPEEEDKINDDLASLVDRVQRFFLQPVFRSDYLRARALFAGPYGDASLEDKEDFLYGFWDYFFFDYHMTQEDITPIRYFYEQGRELLSPGDKYILQDLLKTRLSVFYVTHTEEDCIFCRDLFTDEDMLLPIPDNGFTDFKKLILYGHVYPEGIMLLNYVTAVQASTHLRKRIKEEVLGQYESFKKYQMPHASLNDFFTRHAIAVRHTINILANYAQLKVMHATSEEIPLRPEGNAALLSPGQDEIEERALSFGFSCYAAEMAKRMYADYVSVTGRRELRSRRAVTAAVLILVQGLNGMDYMVPDDIIREEQTTKHATIAMIEKIGEALHMEELDPRYRTEEGYVQALYST